MSQFIVSPHKNSAPHFIKNFSVTLLLLTMTGCGANISPNFMDKQMADADHECHEKLSQAVYKTDLEMQEKCLVPEKIKAYRAYHGDIVSNKYEAVELYRMKLLKQVDKGLLSSAQMEQKVQALDASLEAKIEAHNQEIMAAEIKRQQAAAALKLKEQARIAKYYKDHPYEAEQLALQRRQVEALEENNRLQQEESIAAEQRASDEKWRQLFKSTSCTTNYYGGTAYTSCK